MGADAARTSGEPLFRVILECLPPTMDSEALVERLFVLWSLLHGLTGLVLDEQLPHEVLERVPVEGLVRRALQVALDGLLAPASGRRKAGAG